MSLPNTKENLSGLFEEINRTNATYLLPVRAMGQLSQLNCSDLKKCEH